MIRIVVSGLWILRVGKEFFIGCKDNKRSIDRPMRFWKLVKLYVKFGVVRLCTFPGSSVVFN